MRLMFLAYFVPHQGDKCVSLFYVRIICLLSKYVYSLNLLKQILIKRELCMTYVYSNKFHKYIYI